MNMDICILRTVHKDTELRKSGGEWVSSVEVENAAIGYEKRRSRRIDANHPKWGERPLSLILVPKSHTRKKLKLIQKLSFFYHIQIT
ncbi:hypothetical protein ABVN80_00435 [Acinetobacter baumannii]